MKLRRSALLALATFLVEQHVYSQAGREFEAASVKSNVSVVRSQAQRTEGRTFRATNVPPEH